MLNIIFIIFIFIYLAGCAKITSILEGDYLQTSPTIGGNYLQETMSLQQRQLADDAVKQLMTIWLPAKTQLELQHPAMDIFGTALIERLRESGYAVLEFSPKNTWKKPASQEETFSLSYVLDQAGELNLYRLTLIVGSQTITRPYLVENEEFVPAGYWVYKNGIIKSF